jgi:hypothetical protein
MFCGLALDEMLPPMIVYKAQNIYNLGVKEGQREPCILGEERLI